MGFGCGVVMMAAGDSVEQKRAAWRARNDRRRNRNKSGLSRNLSSKNVPHDTFIGAMLELGVYVRPVGRAPSYKAALKAFENRIRGAASFTRVTVRPLRSPVADEIINSDQEPAREYDEPDN